MGYVVKCRACESEVYHTTCIATLVVHVWCDVCKVSDAIYKFDDETIQRFYKVDNEKDHQNG